MPGRRGHKLQKRFAAAGGVAALAEHSRAPRHVPHKTPPQVAELVTKARREHPDWGPKKLKDVLEKRLQCSLPSSSTIGRSWSGPGWLNVDEGDRGCLAVVAPVQARRPTTCGASTTRGSSAWRSELLRPATLTDQVSRYILACDGMAAISDAAAQDTCQEVFRAHGLPNAMRSTMARRSPR